MKQLTPKIVLLISFCLFSLMSWGAKADGQPLLVRQPDGSMLTVVLHGDEHCNWYATLDGTLLVQAPGAYYVAKVSDNGDLTSAGVLAHEPLYRSKAEQLAVTNQQRDLFYAKADARQRASMLRRTPVSTDTTLFPHKGEPHALVILVNFADTTFSLSNPKASFEQYLNAEDHPEDVVSGFVNESRNYKGVTAYFNDMSKGQFKPHFDVVGPVTLSKASAVYGAGTNDRMDLLIPEACKLVDDSVDFTKYDLNNDGNVDLVYIIYAGHSASVTGNPTSCIWPKSGTGSYGTYDGKRVVRYGVNNELNGRYTAANKFINGIGLFIHEFSHTMGLPDLYATSGSSGENADNQGMEYWSVMDGGEYVFSGRCPTAYTAWEREVFGWMNIDTLSDTTHVDLPTIDKADGKAYKILNDADPSGREYVVLQNIQLAGWNQKLPGHGLLAYRVKYSRDVVSTGDRPNDEKGKPQIVVLAADGTLGAATKYTTEKAYYADMAGDTYPGSTATDSIHAFTMMDGSELVRPILNIKEDTGVVSFDYLGVKNVVPDGIKHIDNAGKTQGDGRYYTLDGRLAGTSAASLPKGIYIVNRQKVYIK